MRQAEQILLAATLSLAIAVAAAPRTHPVPVSLSAPSRTVTEALAIYAGLERSAWWQLMLGYGT
jgi:hypothetical protein